MQCAGSRYHPAGGAELGAGRGRVMSVRERDELQAFLDREGRFKTWPAKAGKQRIALSYLAAKFEPGRDYSERQVNDVLKSWHTFGDHTWLRRDLCDCGLLRRTPDGARYWRSEQ